MWRNLLAAVAVGCFALGSAQAETIRAVTAETLSPFTRAPNDELPGFNVELMQAMAAQAGLQLELEYLPWKRAQAEALAQPDLLLFGATRNAARENKYSWVVKLLDVERVFVTTGAPVNSFAEAETLGAIGARSVYAKELDEMGWGNVEMASTDQANLRKLQAGRVDAIYGLARRSMFEWQQLGYPASDLTVGGTVKTSEIWLAAHPDYPKATAEKLAAALAAVQANGTYDALYDKYFAGLNSD